MSQLPKDRNYVGESLHLKEIEEEVSETGNWWVPIIPRYTYFINWLALIGAITISISTFFPWMYLFSPNFQGQISFFRGIRGIDTTLGIAILVIAMIVSSFAVMRFRARRVILPALGLITGLMLWIWYGNFEAWFQLNELEQSLGVSNPAPQVSIGIAFYLAVAGVVLLVLSFTIRHPNEVTIQ